MVLFHITSSAELIFVDKLASRYNFIHLFRKFSLALEGDNRSWSFCPVQLRLVSVVVMSLLSHLDRPVAPLSFVEFDPYLFSFCVWQ